MWHYLNRWWLVYRRIYASLGFNELNNTYAVIVWPLTLSAFRLLWLNSRVPSPWHDTTRANMELWHRALTKVVHPSITKFSGICIRLRFKAKLPKSNVLKKEKTYVRCIVCDFVFAALSFQLCPRSLMMKLCQYYKFRNRAHDKLIWCSNYPLAGQQNTFYTPTALLDINN